MQCGHTLPRLFGCVMSRSFHTGNIVIAMDKQAAGWWHVTDATGGIMPPACLV